MQEKIKKLINGYYEPYAIRDVNKLIAKIYSAKSVNDSKLELEKNKSYIRALQERYKNLAYERNRLAKRSGFSDFFEYLYSWDKIPFKQDFLDKQSAKMINKVVKNIPNRIKNEPWFGTIFHSFNYEPYFESNYYKTPVSAATSFLYKNKILSKEEFKQIKLIPNSDNLFYVDCDFNKKAVKLHYDKTSIHNFSGFISFIHEMGHALYCRKLIDKKINPKEKSSYEHELKAFELELKYEKTLPAATRNLLKNTLMQQYINYQFEQKIYEDYKADYAEVYANSMRLVLPSLKAKKNPLYALDYSLVHYPCYSTVYTAVYTKLLLWGN